MDFVDSERAGDQGRHVSTTTLFNPQQGHQVLTDLWAWAKPRLLQGKRLRISVKEATRSLDQNAKFHAMCEDIARSGVQWAGKRRTKDEWKVLLVSGHAVATKAGAEIVPGLEGEFVNIRESTASMDKARASSLIEYTLAFGAQHGVTWSDENAGAPLSARAK